MVASEECITLYLHGYVGHQYYLTRWSGIGDDFSGGETYFVRGQSTLSVGGPTFFNDPALAVAEARNQGFNVVAALKDLWA